MKKLALAVFALAASASHAATLYDNGPAVGANNLSVLATGATTIGYGDQLSSNNAVADDFNIASGSKWNVSSLSFFAYQTNATGFTFTNAAWKIISGDNPNTGTVLASGTTAVTNGGRVGYRVTPTTTSNTSRPIFELDADIPDLTLTSGHYWLTWSLGGTLASGPWQPPVSDNRTGNAMQSLNGGAFAAVKDPATLETAEMPFQIQGTVAAVPEPETYAMLLGGLGLIGLARRRQRNK